MGVKDLLKLLQYIFQLVWLDCCKILILPLTLPKTVLLQYGLLKSPLHCGILSFSLVLAFFYEHLWMNKLFPPSLVFIPALQWMSQARALCNIRRSIRATQLLSKPHIVNICRGQLLTTCSPCWVVLGHFCWEDLSPLRQQRRRGKNCTSPAPAGSAAMQGCNGEIRS